MASKTSTTSTTSLTRDDLSTVYMFVVNNWAVTASEIVDGTGLDKGQVTSALRKIARTGLLEGTKVNEDRHLTWQSYYDIENSDVRKTRAAAKRDFAKAFPEDEQVEEGGKRGPDRPHARIDEKAMKAVIRRVKKGEDIKVVAADLGINSPRYLGRKIVSTFGEDAMQPTARKR